MKDDYRQHSRNTQEYREGHESVYQENPYEGGTVEWLNWLIGKEEKCDWGVEALPVL